MAMSLGDFFSAAPHARPVNPKPVTFTAVSRDKILPGGAVNHSQQQVAAKITAAFVFIGGDGATEARKEAQKSLRERFPGETLDAQDVNLETVYQQMFRALHEWDGDEKKIGDRLFDNVDLMRKIVQPSEILRVNDEYFAYVDEEHPEVVDDATFPDAAKGSARVAK